MPRFPCVALILAVLASPGRLLAEDVPNWHMEYTPSHRASFEEEWKYRFPKVQSREWVIAIRYPPELAWSKDVEGKAQIFTSNGWKELKEVQEGSSERRKMFIIDLPHDDPKLVKGFTLRTTLTATICDQRLKKGKPAEPVAPLSEREEAAYLAATPTYDFEKPLVRRWMNEHRMWIGADEPRLDFVRRVYKELRVKIPYNTADGGEWICSQILKSGFGECARHSIVGTSILRANKIPARTVCAIWAVDEKSDGSHCWDEFFLNGVGWVPYDTTLGDDINSDAFFGRKKGELIGGMVDFDWVIDAGPFGRQVVQSIDAFPAFWSKGKGELDDEKLDSHTKVQIIQRFR